MIPTDHDDVPDIGPGGDPPRDARLGALLAGAVGRVPGDVDYAALERRIARAAVERMSGGAAPGATSGAATGEVPMRRPGSERAGGAARRTVAWWEHTARWARTAVPVGTAAGIAALALVMLRPLSAEATLTFDRATLLSAVASSVEARDVAERLEPGAGEEWMQAAYATTSGAPGSTTGDDSAAAAGARQ